MEERLTKEIGKRTNIDKDQRKIRGQRRKTHKDKQTQKDKTGERGLRQVQVQTTMAHGIDLVPFS